MPFVARDSSGTVTAVSEKPREEILEELPDDDPQLVDFLLQLTGELNVKQRLLASDADMARVVEDLIEVLLEKRTILLTDFPQPAQKKFLRRRHLREQVNSLMGLVDQD